MLPYNEVNLMIHNFPTDIHVLFVSTSEIVKLFLFVAPMIEFKIEQMQHDTFA